MTKLLKLLPLLVLLALPLPVSSRAQAIIQGQPCGAPGANGIATNGVPVVCTGSPLVWTSPTGGGSASGSPTVGALGSFGATVSPYAYGAKVDGKYIVDATMTNTSQSITCSNSDCGFTSADNGKIEFGTTGGWSAWAAAGTLIVPQGTLTVVSANAATASVAATAGCTPASNVLCYFAWGDDDTSALNQAATAAWSSSAKCQAIEIASGISFIQNQILFVSNSNLNTACGGLGAASVSSIDMTQTGPEVWGQGPGNSVFIPTPTLTTNVATRCTGGPSANACVGGTSNMEIHDLGVNGLQQDSSGTAAVIILDMPGSVGGGGCTGSTGFNLTIADWLYNVSTSVGIRMGSSACGDPTYFNIVSERDGATNCLISSGGVVLTVTGLACFGNTSIGLQITGTGVVDTNGGYYSASNPGSGSPAYDVCASTGNLFINSYGESINGSLGSSAANFNVVTVTNACSGVSYTSLVNDYISQPSSTTVTSNLIAMFGTSGSTIKMRDNVWVNSGTNNRNLSIAANNIFVNEGGLTVISGGTVADSLSGTQYAFPSEGGTVTCATSAATITFKNTGYQNNPFVTIQDQTTAGIVTQTSISKTTKVVGCPGASDVLLYTVTPNVY